MSTYSGVISAYSGVISAYSGVISTYSGVISTDSGVISTYSGVISTYSGVIRRRFFNRLNAAPFRPISYDTDESREDTSSQMQHEPLE
jgi:hypothetical protein